MIEPLKFLFTPFFFFFFMKTCYIVKKEISMKRFYFTFYGAIRAICEECKYLDFLATILFDDAGN